MKKKLQSLLDMKTMALLLKNNMASFLTGEALLAQCEFEELVTRFHGESAEWILPEDAEAARSDVDLFISQLDRAIERARSESESE